MPLGQKWARAVNECFEAPRSVYSFRRLFLRRLRKSPLLMRRGLARRRLRGRDSRRANDLCFKIQGLMFGICFEFGICYLATGLCYRPLFVVDSGERRQPAGEVVVTTPPWPPSRRDFGAIIRLARQHYFSEAFYKGGAKRLPQIYNIQYTIYNFFPSGSYPVSRRPRSRSPTGRSPSPRRCSGGSPFLFRSGSR